MTNTAIAVRSGIGVATTGYEMYKKYVVNGEKWAGTPWADNRGGVLGGSKGGTSTKITNNLGKEIDITPSSNHSTVTKNSGYKGTPNSSIDILDNSGDISTGRKTYRTIKRGEKI